MNEELIYEYPTSTERQQVLNEIDKVPFDDLNRTKIKPLILALAGFALIFVSGIFSSPTITNIIFIVALITIIISFAIMKNILNNRATGLIITAYESHMQLTSLDNLNKYFKRTLNVQYNDIVYCGLSKDCTTVTMIYRTENSSEECSNTNETVTNELNGTFTFRIIPYSYEQYFFLYIAPQLFKVQTKGWKIAKRFGTEYEYAEKYLQ
ncbi:hypothetical protein [Ruminococcus sp.]|uniref:hypothetical protein n=1 Tax=Ruminococcus sp. TaxID=41978 RepID=UPI0025DEF3CC|nr:hypothetical protein [Ruminococcus sp.]